MDSRGSPHRRASREEDDDEEIINRDVYLKVSKTVSTVPMTQSAAFDTLVGFLGQESEKDIRTLRRRKLDKICQIGELMASNQNEREKLRRSWTTQRWTPSWARLGNGARGAINEITTPLSIQNTPQHEVKNSTEAPVTNIKKQITNLKQAEEQALKMAKKEAKKAKKEAKKAKKVKKEIKHRSGSR